MIRARLTTLPGDRSGMSAVEFALMMPVILLLFMVGFAFSDAIACNRKVTTTAKSIADLTSRYSSVASSDLSTILAASTQVLAPYKASLATIRVSEVKVTGASTSTVQWSQASNGSALATNAAVAVPSGMAAVGSYLVMGEVSYSYTPLFTYGVAQPMTLYDRVFMSPRMSDQVTLQ